MKKVSVIIPCYNAGQYIQQTVDSVFAQTYTNWEIIIVDDGSTDGTTREILQKITHPKITLYYQENKGVAAARNFAIHNASGEIILPLDADDLIAPTYMEKGIPLFDKIPQLGIVYCRAEKFGKETGEWILPPFSEEKMVIQNMIFCTAFFKKDDWLLAKGFPEYAVHGAEDYAFWLQILQLGRQVYQIDEILFYYRIHTVSRSTSFLEAQKKIIETRALIFKHNTAFFAKHAETFYQYILYREDIIREPKLLKCYLWLKPFLLKWVKIKNFIKKNT